MAKRKNEPAAWTDYPPDIFWITPDGKVMDVIGHLTAMQGDPEAFGLASSPVEKDEVDDAFGQLWSQGWVRGRFSDGTFSFQMERPRGLPMGNAYDMVATYRPHVKEIEVEFADPSAWKMRKNFTAEEFLAQKFPGAWGLGSKKRK